MSNKNTKAKNTNDQLVQQGEVIIRDLEAQGVLPATPGPTPATPPPAEPTVQMRVSCGANTVTLDGMQGVTVTQVRDKMREILNVTDDHRVVLVNGREIDLGRPYPLTGNEDLEFKKPAGDKG